MPRVPAPHLHAVAQSVQVGVGDGAAGVAGSGFLALGRGQDLVAARHPLHRGEHPNLPPGHLLSVHVHRLQGDGVRGGGVRGQGSREMVRGRSLFISGKKSIFSGWTPKS